MSQLAQSNISSEAATSQAGSRRSTSHQKGTKVAAKSAACLAIALDDVQRRCLSSSTPTSAHLLSVLGNPELTSQYQRNIHQRHTLVPFHCPQLQETYLWIMFFACPVSWNIRKTSSARFSCPWIKTAKFRQGTTMSLLLVPPSWFFWNKSSMFVSVPQHHVL